MQEPAFRINYGRVALSIAWALAGGCIGALIGYVTTKLGIASNQKIVIVIASVLGFFAGFLIFGIMNMGSLCSREEEKDERYRS